jgi:hypothetical protein
MLSSLLPRFVRVGQQVQLPAGFRQSLLSSLQAGSKLVCVLHDSMNSSACQCLHAAVNPFFHCVGAAAAAAAASDVQWRTLLSHVRASALTCTTALENEQPFLLTQGLHGPHSSPWRFSREPDGGSRAAQSP